MEMVCADDTVGVSEGTGVVSTSPVIYRYSCTDRRVNGDNVWYFIIIALVSCPGTYNSFIDIVPH